MSVLGRKPCDKCDKKDSGYVGICGARWGSVRWLRTDIVRKISDIGAISGPGFNSRHLHHPLTKPARCAGSLLRWNNIELKRIDPDRQGEGMEQSNCQVLQKYHLSSLFEHYARKSLFKTMSVTLAVEIIGTIA